MAHKPITFHLLGHAMCADGGILVAIPYPPGVDRSVTVTDYATDLPREARRLATEAEAEIIKMAGTSKVIGICVSARVARGQISPRGFNDWSKALRNPAMCFDLSVAAT